MISEHVTDRVRPFHLSVASPQHVGGGNSRKSLHHKAISMGDYLR